ncbi:unnamed protein product [Cylindrotheca closterium]|uniref:Uncharacterized protein n=1 Tax=Cylindrotheca closterium TaxID=2856 RepID=A0AAD2JN71_9STRA|nr:unnamed protein product [Cylindrotheca closterium]
MPQSTSAVGTVSVSLPFGMHSGPHMQRSPRSKLWTGFFGTEAMIRPRSRIIRPKWYKKKTVWRFEMGNFRVVVTELHLLDMWSRFGMQARSCQESILVTVSVSRHGRTPTKVFQGPICIDLGCCFAMLRQK